MVLESQEEKATQRRQILRSFALFSNLPRPLCLMGLHLSLSLTNGRPLSRLDKAKASFALCSLLHRFPLLRRGENWFRAETALHQSFGKILETFGTSEQVRAHKAFALRVNLEFFNTLTWTLLGGGSLNNFEVKWTETESWMWFCHGILRATELCLHKRRGS